MFTAWPSLIEKRLVVSTINSALLHAHFDKFPRWCGIGFSIACIPKQEVSIILSKLAKPRSIRLYSSLNTPCAQRAVSLFECCGCRDQADIDVASSGGGRHSFPPVILSISKEMLLYLQALKNHDAKNAFRHYRGAYRCDQQRTVSLHIIC